MIGSIWPTQIFMRHFLFLSSVHVFVSGTFTIAAHALESLHRYDVGILFRRFIVVLFDVEPASPRSLDMAVNGGHPGAANP